MASKEKTGPAKYKPAWAYIIFELDSKREIIPISDIKYFNPVDQFSFDKEKTVQALYRYKDDVHVPEYFAARILKLGLTKETLMEDVSKRRIPAPKIFDEDKEDLSFVELSGRVKNKGNKVEKDKSTKKADLKKKLDKKKSFLEANTASLAAAKLAQRKRVHKEEETSSDEEVLVSKKYLKVLAKTSSNNTSAIEDLKKRVKYLEKEKKKKEPKDASTLEKLVDETSTLVKIESGMVKAANGAQDLLNGKIKIQLETDVVKQADTNHEVKIKQEDTTNPEPFDYNVNETPVVAVGDEGTSVSDKNDMEAPITISAPNETSSCNPPVAGTSESSNENKNEENEPDILKNYVLPTLLPSQLGKLAKHSGNNNKWIKELAGFVFPPGILAICSFSGAGSNRNKKTIVYPSLPQAGKQYMLEMYEKKLLEGGCKDFSVLATVEQTVKSAVNEKCSSYRRPRNTKPAPKQSD